MNYLGVSAEFHDAGVAVISDGEILFASHSERYSKHKHDANICTRLIDELKKFDIGHIAYFERPWAKQVAKIYAGQRWKISKMFTSAILKHQLSDSGLAISGIPVSTWPHHLSHAAAGFQTSEFDKATVVVIDAIGEFDTVTIWAAHYDNQQRAKYKRLWSQRYPHSIGLFYSAITERLGLHPMDEEYITMGMAAYGNGSKWLDYISDKFVENFEEVCFKHNFHLGIDKYELSGWKDEDIAATAQIITEKLIDEVMKRAYNFGWSSNLVYAGGVALNCLANRNIGKFFDKIWIMPSPGDAGSSVGAAALAYGGPLSWRNAYLGHDIAGLYPVEALLQELLDNQIVGVANGRAEFGPRALGNRSLLADPRGKDIKDRVNEIKRRQKFRPFAPAILEEHVDLYFAMPASWSNSRYMQVVAGCWRPDLYPAICHVDGTSRVQTVPKDGSGFRRLLEAWYDCTGCPMLLNTSLNIRGEPMVNDVYDARRFENLYGVKVLT